MMEHLNPRKTPTFAVRYGDLEASRVFERLLWVAWTRGINDWENTRGEYQFQFINFASWVIAPFDKLGPPSAE